MAGTRSLHYQRKAVAAERGALPAAEAASSPGKSRGVDWTLIAPPVVTLIVMLWGITAPSYWRDESATLAAVMRPIPGLLRLLGRVDAVHGFYYLLMWPVVHLAGSGEFATRLPSAIAMAAAALGVTAIGRRIRSRRAGLYAGLVFASLPLVSVRGHDARPYALETAAAVLASYLMLRAAEEPRPRRLAAYGLSVVLLGYMQMFGLLILTAHAIAWIPAARRLQARRGEAGGSNRPGTAGLARRWLLTVVAAAVALGPLFWLGWRQRVQIAWLPRPGGHAIYLMITDLACTSLASVFVVAGLVLLGAVRAGRPGRSPGRLLTWLALPWLVLPPASLVITSQFVPVYQFTYVEFCLPAVALLAGAGIAALDWPRWRAAGHWPPWLAARHWPSRPTAWRWSSQPAGRRPPGRATRDWPLRSATQSWPLRWAALGLLVALGLPAQLAIRTPSAGGSLWTAAQILARSKHPGDAVFYPGDSVPAWNIAYPAGFGGLRDIGLGETAVAADRLVGIPASPGVVQRRLRRVRRLWVIEMRDSWQPAGITLLPAFRLAATYRTGSIWMRLYIRAAPESP